jgi:DNA polymerase-3 subunit delta
VTPEELHTELERGELRPAYLIAGEEPLLRDDALAKLRETVLGEGAEDFNFDRLAGSTASAGALLDSVRTLPVMAPRRLVLLRDPEAARGGAKELTEAVAEAVAELPSGSETVLVVVAEKADRRARWVKAFGAPAIVDCSPPRGERQIVAFVRAEAQRQGVEFERGVAELLAERIGPHLLMLRQEIAKAALLAGDGKRVTREQIVAGASDVAEEPIWDLTDAIGEGRAADALAALAKLLRVGAAPPLLLGALASHFRRLLKLRSGGGVAGPPFVRRKLEGQARRFTERRLLACLRAIHQADLALKGEGGLPPQLTLERLVIGLAG